MGLEPLATPHPQARPRQGVAFKAPRRSTPSLPPAPHPRNQATLSGVLTAGMFYFISNAKPLDVLSPARPHPSIFNVYFFGSLVGQFAAQLAFLIWMYR